MSLLKTLHHLFPFKQSLLPFSLISDHSSSSLSSALSLPSIPPTFFQLHPIYVIIYASFTKPTQTKPCSFTILLFSGGSRASCFSSSSHSTKSQLKTTTLHFSLITTTSTSTTLTPCLRSNTTCTNTTIHVTPLAFSSHRRERFPMHQILSTTVESVTVLCFLSESRLQNEHIEIQV